VTSDLRLAGALVETDDVTASGEVATTDDVTAGEPTDDVNAEVITGEERVEEATLPTTDAVGAEG